MKRSQTTVAFLSLLGALSLFAPAGASGPPLLTEPVNATKFDLEPARTYTSPSIAVDPANHNNMVMGFVEAASKRCGLLRSIDSGETWTKLESSPSPDSYPFCLSISATVNMIPIAFGRDSTLYYALLGFGPDEVDGGYQRGNISVLLARSDDLGDTWTTTVARNTRDKQGDATETNRPVSGIAVDTTSGPEDIIHIVYRGQWPIQAAPNQQPRLPMVITSVDAGKTFSEPIDVSAPAWAKPEVRAAARASATPATGTPARPPAGSRAAQPDLPANYGGSNPAVTVDRRGNVYVAWNTHSSNITPAPDTAIWVSKSTDRGKTFTASAATPFGEVLSTCCSANILWSPKGGPEGTLHVVYEGTSRPELEWEADIFHRRSVDGGVTWTAPKRLNDDDPSDLYTQYSPGLAIAPNGRMDVAWFDSRLDPGVRLQDVYTTWSSDNGDTWARNVRVTDRSIDRRMGVWANGYNVSVPPGIASTNELAVVAWDDTRNGDLALHVQDLYSSVVQHETIRAGGVPVMVQVALAAGAGLAFVGLVLALARRAMPSSGGASDLRSPAPARSSVTVAARRQGSGALSAAD